MRKFIKELFCCILCISLIAMTFVTMADGAQGPMNVSWKADYGQQIVLTVTFKSPAPYVQQVTAVMYPYDAVNPTVTNYCRMKEVTSLSGTETTVSFIIGDDLNETSGKYKVKLQGNGHLSAQNIEIVDVDILNPSRSLSLLGRINLATTTNEMASLLGEGDAALQLHLENDPAKLEKLMLAFLEIKRNEYQNNFSCLDAVREAYLKSSIMVCIKEPAVTTTELRQIVEANATLIGIDIVNEDYLSVADRVYSKIISVKNTYGGTGILTCAQLADAIRTTTAVELVNVCSTIDSLASVVADYYSLLGIDNTVYSKYTFYTDINKQKVLRQIYNKNFTFATDIKKAFEEGVDKTAGGDNGDGSSENNNEGSHVSLGGAGTGGSETGTIPDTTKTLIDIDSKHWAYAYVDALSKISIISGYPDGSFKPEKTVTRDEFVKMVISAAGLYDQSAEAEFEDISGGHWAYRYIASAKCANIVGGISESTFGTGQTITRQDVAVIVARIIDLFDKTSSVDANDSQTAFHDNDEISEYAKASVKVLINRNIIDGYDNGSFGPFDPLTRAQAAKIIYLLRECI